MKINIPSPVKKLSFRSANHVNYSFLIKRDDLIHPLISGNKWRKLSGHLGSGRVQTHGGIITCGGPWSNHLLAAACAAKMFHIPIIGFVRGDYHQYLNEVLLRAQDFGMELHFLSNQDFDLLQKHPHIFLTSRNLRNNLFIPMGGDDEAGRNGSKTIVQEVIDQECRPDIWLVAAGKGTTACGIMDALDYPSEVYVFPAINQPEEITILDKKLKASAGQTNYTIMQPHRCRFGSIDDKFLDFIKSFYVQTDILLDPIYNGKMLELFFEQSKEEFNSKSVIAYHSGGLYGWKGIAKRYGNRFDFSFLPAM